LPATTTGLETEWDYSGRKGRDGQKKKIGKAKERKEKVKRGKDEEVNGQGGKRGAPAPHGVPCLEPKMTACILYSDAYYTHIFIVCAVYMVWLKNIRPQI